MIETVTKKSLNYHLGNDAKNCGMCQNYELTGECGVLHVPVMRSGICDAYVNLEKDTGAPAAINQDALIDRLLS